MSKFRTAIRLKAGDAQGATESGASAPHQEVFVPLNSDGSAVQLYGVPESIVTSKASAVPTAVYVGSTAIDLAGCNGVWISVDVTVAESATCNIKFGWSPDNVTYRYQQYKLSGATDGGDIIYNWYDERYDLDMSSTDNHYQEAFSRAARYFKVFVKSNATTGKVAVYSQRLTI